MHSTEFYHGSKNNNLKTLDISFAYKENPFGPAIYLTKDIIVAKKYTGNHGKVYLVKFEMNKDCIINLNQRVKEHPEKVRDIIICLAKKHSDQPDVNNLITRDAIHPVTSSLEESNKYLLKQGISMLYGELEEMEKSGTMDKGTQYALLKSIEIIGAV